MPPVEAPAIPVAAPAAVAPAAAVPAVSPAPAVAAAPAATADVPVVAAVPAAEPVVEPAAAPAIEAPKADAVAAVPAEGAPAAEAPKPAEGEPAVVEPAAPKYEFKMPEGVKMDTVQIGAFTGILAEHNIPPEVGQKFIDLGATLVKAQVDAVVQGQHDAFAETRRGWVQEVDKFGNQRDTIVNDAKFAITDTIKDAKERAAVWDVLGMTGAGDNPLFIKAMAKIGKRLRERSAPPADTPNSAGKNGSPADRRYGAKT